MWQFGLGVNTTGVPPPVSFYYLNPFIRSECGHLVALDRQNKLGKLAKKRKMRSRKAAWKNIVFGWILDAKMGGPGW